MNLERGTLQAASIPPKAIINMLNKVKEESHELHGIMLVKGGKVVFERFWQPFAPQYRHQLFSLSKSFTSTAVGFAVQEGLLTVNTKLSDIFTAEFDQLGQKIDDEVKDMTVKNLLTMSTGMEYEGWDEGNSNNILSFLSSHVKESPGEIFRYSSIATYMCSSAVTRLTGQSVAEYLSPRLFEPLGIEASYWSMDSKTGSSTGGFGLNIALEDIAKFGKFVLQKGMWEGKQLLSPAWFDEATSKQIENGTLPDNDWCCGYGYQYWRCQPEGVFRGDGMFGQFCVIVPEMDMVIASTGNVDLQKVLNIYWEMLKDMKALPVDEKDAETLAAMDQFSYLDASKPGDAYPKLRAMYESDKPGLNFYFDFNDRDGVFCICGDIHQPPKNAFFFEHGKWTKGAAQYSPDSPFLRLSHEKPYRLTTFGAWEGKKFHATCWYYESACKDEMRFTFNEDRSEVTVEQRGFNFNDPFQEICKGKRVSDQ